MRKNITSTYIYRSLLRLGVEAFRDEEFGRLFGFTPARTYAVLHRLASSGIVRRLASGLYIVAGLGGSPAEAQPFFLGTRLVEPSYVSFWSALHYYGWTEQVPRLVLLATPRASGRRRAGSFAFRFVKLSPSRFFGYMAAHDGDLEFPVAEPEKAIVDSLFLPRVAGGVELVAGALEEALPTLELSRLEEYAIRMDFRSLASRLGHLLARAGIESEPLRSHRSSVYVKLEPRGPRRGRYDRRWMVVDNLARSP